jgi:Holliday junction DNA helicase RuvA
MIDYIEGYVEYIDADGVVLGTGQGVGYRVFCPNPYLYTTKEHRRIFTHHHVREDAIHLYGFVLREERNLFRKLLDVSGIGPKSALAILASAIPEQLVSAIQQEDVVFLSKFPGIGKKTASRIVLDLKDKLTGFTYPLANTGVQSAGHTKSILVSTHSHSRQEAMEALKALGYHDKEIQRVMAEVDEDNASTEVLIKKALALFISTSR